MTHGGTKTDAPGAVTTGLPRPTEKDLVKEKSPPLVVVDGSPGVSRSEADAVSGSSTKSD